MIFYLAILVIILTAVRLVVVILNFRQWPGNYNPVNEPLVSVLIPARNEEHNIGNIITDLVRHDYKNIEVLIYDDLSEDKTSEVARLAAGGDERIRVIRGEALPATWKGKNYGCHKLAEMARGEYYLFLDADVRIHSNLIKRTLAMAQKNSLDLLSLFPTQKMNSLPEWLTVPLMNWILVSLLPLALVRKSPLPSLSAANGQFMLFRADIYRREQFHKTLKNENVEDIAIARLMKEKGYKVQTLLGNNLITCRMYQSWVEARNGFSRNIFAFFGGSRWLAFFYAAVTVFGFIPVVMSLPLLSVIVFYVLPVMMLRIMVSLWSRQNVLINLMLGPLQMLTLAYITCYAYILQLRKSTSWKGRIVD